MTINRNNPIAAALRGALGGANDSYVSNGRRQCCETLGVEAEYLAVIAAREPYIATGCMGTAEFNDYSAAIAAFNSAVAERSFQFQRTGA